MHRMQDVTIMPYLNIKPKIANSVFIAAGTRISGDVDLEDEISIWFNCSIRGDVNFIRVGARTNIQDGTVIHVSSKDYPTIIGREVTIGHNATVHACTIGDLSLIGMGAVVLDGAVIGSRSLVAAGALIPPGRVYPDQSLIVGSPAVVKRKLRKDELDHLQYSADNYVEVAKNYIAGLL